MTKALQLQNKSVCVLGAGISGIATCRFLETQNAKVTLLDDADLNLVNDRIQKHGGLPRNTILKNGINAQTILNADLIVLSPGISMQHTAIQAALKNSIPIINEIDLAFPFLSDCRFVGITGSNGKSTTTSILGSIAKNFDSHAFVGGNLGEPLCNVLLQNCKPQIAILELSSYQLEILTTLKLQAAIVTNLTPDHLDRYPSVEAYYQAKIKIFDLLVPNGKVILNKSDKNSVKYLHATTFHDRLNFNVAPFEEGVSILADSLSVQLPHLKEKFYLKTDHFLGQHNRENAAAAVAGALSLNIPVNVIQKGLDDYPGIAHRLETLGFINNIRWVNDSKATNIESALIAIKTFDQNVHLILGGLGKKSSYQPLVNACQKRVKAIYAIGQDAPLILEAFKSFVCFDAKTLEQAVSLAQKNTVPGDTILLAPACASFDQFENFAERGNLFRKLFQKEKKYEVNAG